MRETVVCSGWLAIVATCCLTACGVRTPAARDRAPSARASAGIETEDTAGQVGVQTLLRRLAGYGYAGAVAVGDAAGLWFSDGYGLRDRERNLPFEATTGIDIGSLTKVFTATLILQLVEEGRLELDASIDRYLTDVPADKASITVHELLTHTSGLLRSAIRLGVGEETDRNGFIAAVLQSDLLFPPGNRFEYSDTGYDLLAALAEIVTGQSYEAVLAHRVLEPAGLSHTGYVGSPAVSMANVADSYSAPLGSPWNDEREGPSSATWYNRGSGGLVSTVADLQALVRALRSGQLLDTTTVALMMTAHVNVDGDLGYGYGWFVRDRGRSRPTVFHGGDIAGYKAYLEIDLGSGRIVSALDNVLGWERVTDQYVVAAWDGNGPDLPPAVQPAAGDGRTLAGTYRTDRGDTLVLWDEAGALVGEARGQAVADRLFGTTDDRLWRRTAAAERVMTAFANGDTAYLTSVVRERDRIAEMPQRLLRIWAQLGTRRGPAKGWRITGSYPAQDGTVISLVNVLREGGADPLRLIWRGSYLVAVGGSQGLRAPTATLTIVDHHRAARFEPSTGLTTRIDLTLNGHLTLTVNGRSALTLRGTIDAVPPPTRSLTRAVIPTFFSEGSRAGLDAIRHLQQTQPEAFDFGEEELNRLGYRLLHAAAPRFAIAVFRYNVQLHRGSWNAYDSLGEACLAAGDIAAAREAYRESLRLNPNNETAKRVLERTKGSP